MSQVGQPEIATPPWTESRLLGLISNEIEENSSLEYKRAAALDRRDSKKKVEITKDVSAFANSAGGTLIYGIAEGEGEEEHIPVRIDPVDRNQFTKEWLEQIISGINPRIDGLKIHPVQVESPHEGVCYVVEIPESVTAHQAADLRYYKRGNFIAEPMRDYEVRLVMNRARHPILEIELRLTQSYDNLNQLKTLQLRILNIGPRIAKQYMVDLTLPIHFDGVDHGIDNLNTLKHDDNGNWRVLLPTSLNPKPIFPNSERILTLNLIPGVRFQRPQPVSNSPIVCRLYADEMPVVERSIAIHELSSSWH